MLKKTILLIVIVIFIFLSFGAGFVSEAFASLVAPFRDTSLDELLANIAIVNFAESTNIRSTNILLTGITELYMPLNVFQNPHLWIIGIPTINDDDPIIIRDDISGAFIWHRNGIIDEYFSDLLFSWRLVSGCHVTWSQHGQEFEVIIPEYFTEEERYDFVNAQPLIAWEIQGNAISVSIQGMENISIFDEDGYEIVNRAIVVSDFFGEHTHILSDINVLYRSNGESLNRIGYRWRLYADSSKYQYVLEPGIYTVYAESGIGEPGLLIRHFANREFVSSIDYSAELVERSVCNFSVTVRPGGDNDTVVIYPSDIPLVLPTLGSDDISIHNQLEAGEAEITLRSESIRLIRPTLDGLVSAGQGLHIVRGPIKVSLPVEFLAELRTRGYAFDIGISAGQNVAANDITGTITFVADGNNITNFNAEYNIFANLGDLDLEGLNLYRVSATINNQNIGGLFSPATDMFEVSTSLMGELTISYVEDLRRLRLMLGLYQIEDLARETILTMDIVPLVQQGYTWVSVYSIAEKLGAEINWCNIGSHSIVISLDGQGMRLDVGGPRNRRVQIIDDHTMVPIRLVSERLGATVYWDEATRTIEIVR